jgi:tetratricopeptide (TPR) repeat protein
MVGGMPLGLELAASWLELLPPEEIAVEISNSLDFLETDQVDVPDRQRSVRAIFDTSWKLLNEDERQAFLALSVFVGSFTRQAAQTVSSAALRSLLSLANKAWLQQVEGGRFQLHALLQHYGLEQLQRNEAAWRRARDRHAAYYAGFVAAQSERMRGPEQLSALQDLAEEFDTNVKAAWDWLVVESSWTEIREKMAMGLFQFGLIRWHEELIEWLREARLKLEPASGSEEKLTLAILGAAEIYFEENWQIKEYQPEARLAALWQLVQRHDLAQAMGLWFVLLGKIYATRNHAPQAEEEVEAAVLRIRAQGDPWLLGTALLIQSYLFGQFFMEPSLVERRSRNLGEALDIFQELGTTYEQGEILRSMAEIALFKKQPFEEVADLFQRAQVFYLNLNDTFNVGRSYIYLGMACFNRGRAVEGFQAFHESRAVFEQLGDQRGVAISLSWESLWATRYSTFEHALETRQESIAYSQKYTSQTDYFWNVFELGEIYRIFGDHEQASAHYEKARLDFERVNMILGLGYYQRALGDIAMREGHYAQALQHFRAYQAYADQDNHTWSMAHASVRQAWAYANLGEVAASRGSIYRCLNLLQNADEVDMELGILLSEARCLAEEEKFETAAALAAYVAGHPLLWKETRDLAQAMLANLPESMDEESFQAACSRLQGRDVRELTSEWLAGYQRQS